MTTELIKRKHTKYFQRILHVLPSSMGANDLNRMPFAFFAISGLDILGSLDEFAEHEKQEAIEWIYRLQVVDGKKSGFQSSTTVPNDATDYRCGHLAMTYTSLASLLVLNDDLSRVDRKHIIEGIEACQNFDGSFSAMLDGCESDMRFLYCACSVSAMLNDWSGIDKEKAIDYILKSKSYEGGIGQGPGLESHGGSTFCAIASLYLMNELHVLSQDELEKLKKWCLMRQDFGFSGRPGKPYDTCYSFWIGATLQMLGAIELSNFQENRSFLLLTQDTIVGGFAKHIYEQPDPLHTYMGLCGLSLLGETNLHALNAALNVSQRTFAHLKEIHKKWENE